MHDFVQSWKWVMSRGVLSILFGVTAIAVPEISLIALVALYAAFAIIDGGILLKSAFSGRLSDKRWLAIAGVTGIAASFGVILYPVVAVTVLVVLIALWAVLHGIFELAASVELHTRSHAEWWLALDGILSLFFGLLLLLRPEQAVTVVALVFGVFALAHGILLLILASRLLNHRTPPARA
jgi:uncharacterized membrane protein HdeD (DUF308 family)